MIYLILFNKEFFFGVTSHAQNQSELMNKKLKTCSKIPLILKREKII